MLGRLEARGFAAAREDGHIIALERGRRSHHGRAGRAARAFGAARPTAAACRDALVAHVREVGEVGAAARHPVHGIGARPFGTLDDVDWLPKAPLRVMRDTFRATAGRAGSPTT